MTIRVPLLSIFLLIVLVVGPLATTRSTPAIDLLRAQTRSAELLPQGSRRIFVGSLGEKYDIRMYLWRETATLSGYYFYETNGGNINLEGTINAKGDFVLKESDIDGNQTGLFKGAITRTGSAAEPNLHLAGTWSKPDGSGAMPFALDEQRTDLGGGLKLATKSINTRNKKPAYTIEAKYPQIEGSTDAGVIGFNKAINSMVTSQIADFKKDVSDVDVDTGGTNESGLTIDYEITAATSAFISVAFSTSPYMAGAAHPNHYTLVANYDLKAGKALTLADVFRPGTGYLQVLANVCIATLKKRLGEMADSSLINEGAAAKRDNYANWIVGPKGLEIIFDAYQVAAYAAGTQRVVIRYEVLKTILNPTGPIAAIAR